jgi:hypothetical protein
MVTKYAHEALVREAEYRQCSGDILYFVNNYVYVNAVDVGGRALMKTANRPHQERLLRDLADSSLRNIIALKSRQVGFTTCCAVASLWWAFFHPDQYILFISRREDDARDILAKADYAYWPPEWMQERGPSARTRHPADDLCQ